MDNNEHCYEGPERREVCTDVLILRQRFEDEEKTREAWRKETDAKLAKIMMFVEKLETPYNFGIWASRIFLGALVLAAASVFIRFIGTHVK